MIARWTYLKVLEKSPAAVSFEGKTRNYLVSTAKTRKSIIKAHFAKDGRQIWHIQLPIAIRADENGRVEGSKNTGRSEMVVIGWASKGKRQSLHIARGCSQRQNDYRNDHRHVDDDFQHPVAQGGSPSVAERLKSLNSAVGSHTIFTAHDQKLAPDRSRAHTGTLPESAEPRSERAMSLHSRSSIPVPPATAGNRGRRC